MGLYIWGFFLFFLLLFCFFFFLTFVFVVAFEPQRSSERRGREEPLWLQLLPLPWDKSASEGWVTFQRSHSSPAARLQPESRHPNRALLCWTDQLKHPNVFKRAPTSGPYRQLLGMMQNVLHFSESYAYLSPPSFTFCITLLFFP